MRVSPLQIPMYGNNKQFKKIKLLYCKFCNDNHVVRREILDIYYYSYYEEGKYLLIFSLSKIYFDVIFISRWATRYNEGSV